MSTLIRSIIFRAAAIALALLFVLCIEFGLRLIAPELSGEGDRIRVLAKKAENRKHSVIKQPDPDLLWKLVPGSPLFENETLNQQGFRGSDFAETKPPGTFRIAILGDSRSFGFGIREYRKTFAYQLEQFLNTQDSSRHTEVINLAVIGYSSFQGKRLLEKLGTTLDPDLLIVWFGFNDILYYHITDSDAGNRSPIPAQLSNLLSRSYIFLMLQKVKRERFPGPTGIIQADQPIVRRVPPTDFRKNLQEIVHHALTVELPVIFMTSPVREGIPMVLNSRKVTHKTDDGRTTEKLICQYDLEGYWLMDAETFPGTESELELLLKTYPDLPILHYFKSLFYRDRSDLIGAEKEEDLARKLDIDRVIIENYNEITREIAQTGSHVSLVDLPEAFRKQSLFKLFVDDCHPNGNGHAIITHEIVEAFRNGFQTR